MNLSEIPYDEQPGRDAACDDRESNPQRGSKDFFLHIVNPSVGPPEVVRRVSPDGPRPVLRGEVAGRRKSNEFNAGEQ